MGGLNTSLVIGLQALEATQGALDATSNNIANANTSGYTREIPQFSENQESVSGSTVSGGGVTLNGLQSIRDELLNTPGPPLIKGVSELLRVIHRTSVKELES